MTTLIIREDSPEARKFLEFAKTLPFVEEKKENSKWEQAIAEGAVPLGEFAGMLREEIRKAYNP